MPATFDDIGLRFLYPDNWIIAAGADDRGSCGVMFDLPTRGFFLIELADTCASDDEVIEQVVATVAAEYDEVERETVTLPDAGENERAVELQFYFLDMLIQSRIMVIYAGEQRLLIQIQAESRDFDAGEPVFAAILKQLREV